MGRVFLLARGGAVAVELDLGIDELDMGLLARGEGRQPVQRLGQAGAGRALPGEPVLAVGLGREGGHHQRVEVVGDVVQGVALVEVEHRAVGVQVGRDLLAESLAGAVDDLGVAGLEGGDGRQLHAVTLPVGGGILGSRVHGVEIADGHLAPEGVDLDADRGGQIVLGQIIGHDQRVEARLVDRVERDLIDVGPVLEVAAGRVQEAAIAGQAPGDGEVEHDRLVLAGLEADLADALARQGAFGVGVGNGAGRAVQRRGGARDDRLGQGGGDWPLAEGRSQQSVVGGV